VEESAKAPRERHRAGVRHMFQSRGRGRPNCVGCRPHQGAARWPAVPPPGTVTLRIHAGRVSPAQKDFQQVSEVPAAALSSVGSCGASSSVRTMARPGRTSSVQRRHARRAAPARAPPSARMISGCWLPVFQHRHSRPVRHPHHALLHRVQAAHSSPATPPAECLLSKAAGTKRRSSSPAISTRRRQPECPAAEFSAGQISCA